MTAPSVTLDQLLAVRDELRRRQVPAARCPACGDTVYVVAHAHGRTLLPDGPVSFYPLDPRACPFCGSTSGRPPP